MHVDVDARGIEMQVQEDDRLAAVGQEAAIALAEDPREHAIPERPSVQEPHLSSGVGARHARRRDVTLEARGPIARSDATSDRRARRRTCGGCATGDPSPARRRSCAVRRESR
jgi:hypothetical protein